MLLLGQRREHARAVRKEQSVAHVEENVTACGHISILPKGEKFRQPGKSLIGCCEKDVISKSSVVNSAVGRAIDACHSYADLKRWTHNPRDVGDLSCGEGLHCGFGWSCGCDFLSRPARGRLQHSLGGCVRFCDAE